MSLIFPDSELVSGTAPGFRSRFNSFFASTFDSRFGSTMVQTFVGTCRAYKREKYIKMINCSSVHCSEETSPPPPLQSTPQMELGSILLGVQNREPKMKKGTQIDILYTNVHHPPPWPHQCSLHKLRVSTPSQAPSSRQGSNPPWGLCGIPRSLFSYDLCV